MHLIIGRFVALLNPSKSSGSVRRHVSAGVTTTRAENCRIVVEISQLDAGETRETPLAIRKLRGGLVGKDDHGESEPRRRILWYGRRDEQTLGRGGLAQTRIERDDGRCFRIERGREVERIEGAQRNRE